MSILIECYGTYDSSYTFEEVQEEISLSLRISEVRASHQIVELGEDQSSEEGRKPIKFTAEVENLQEVIDLNRDLENFDIDIDIDTSTLPETD